VELKAKRKARGGPRRAWYARSFYSKEDGRDVKEKDRVLPLRELPRKVNLSCRSGEMSWSGFLPERKRGFSIPEKETGGEYHQ